MAPRRVLIELGYQPPVAEVAFTIGPSGHGTIQTDALPAAAGLTIDAEFVPTAIPGQQARPEDPHDTFSFDLVTEPEASTYIVRGEVEEEDFDQAVEALQADEGVVGVFADPVIEPAIVCPGDAPVGSDADVERLLCASSLRSIGADGSNVLVAIVDTGVNMAYLNSRGKTPNFDPTRSWVPRPGLTPGSLPVGHGTMCAFDVCIAAPRCTLLDIALLQSTATGPTPMAGFLSDAVRAYRHLIDVMGAPRRPGEQRSLVVNNSWGMFHPSWDFPVGHPGNYSDNPGHPFNRIVGELERVGADILFAAGNCGPDCPDRRCQGVTANAIYGANGHPAVLCVAGVDRTKARVGYSSVGPGRLTREKPDVCGYTHFRGSGVYAADGGTSAATPVVSGVVAAVRSKRHFDSGVPSTHPSAIRTLVTSTAEDLGAPAFDYQYGYGVVSGCEIHRRLRGPITPPDICRRYPWLCRPIPRSDRPRTPAPRQPGRPDPVPAESLAASWTWDAVEEIGEFAASATGEATALDPIAYSYLVGFAEGEASAASEPRANPGP